MKIALFHELQNGGALVLFDHVYKELKNKGCKIDIYKSIVKINQKNIFLNLIDTAFKLPSYHSQIANKINEADYDLILVFPSLITQSPYILNNIIDKNKLFYIFCEPKREFYEKTSFNYFSPRKIISRLIRFPLKLIDMHNCISAKNIITFSYYSKYILKKHYDKESYLIYPGFSLIDPINIITKNNHKLLSVGLHSYLKGHDITIDQLSFSKQEIVLLGRRTQESKLIEKLSEKKHANISFKYSENNSYKENLYKNSSIFIANQRNEPLGLTTVEAVLNNCYVLGLNEGGTPDIVRHGLNGLLYPNNPNVYKAITSNIINKNYIKSFRFYKMSWDKYASDILSLYHYLKNEPNE